MAITKINKKVALYGGVAASVDKTSGDTEPLKVYHVRAKGANSKIPVPTGGFFRSRPGRTQITLVNGDVLTALTLTRICKTDANIAMSEATTEVQDDCMPVMSKVLVGTADLTGTFSGFFKYLDGKLVDISGELVNRWFNKLQDPGNGDFTHTPRTNEPKMLAMCLNIDARVGDTQNWLYLYANLEGTTFGGANADPQTREISFSASDLGVPTFTEVVLTDAKQEIK